MCNGKADFSRESLHEQRVVGTISDTCSEVDVDDVVSMTLTSVALSMEIWIDWMLSLWRMPMFLPRSCVFMEKVPQIAVMKLPAALRRCGFHQEIYALHWFGHSSIDGQQDVVATYVFWNGVSQEDPSCHFSENLEIRCSEASRPT
jgi:hypothetical protein